MKVAVPKETAADERRVALVPEIVEKLTDQGFEIAIEARAGEKASFSDRDYESAGAVVVPSREELLRDVEGIVKVRKPSAEEIELYPQGSILIAFLEPLTDAEGIARLTRRGVVGFALESVPRITRATPRTMSSRQSDKSIRPPRGREAKRWRAF